jgi:phage baseplate assembly protein W
MTQERSAEDQLLIERGVFGFGLKTTLVGVNQTDVAMDDATLSEVQGTEALLQDLRAAFLTGLGTDPLNLDFGFDGARAISEESRRTVLAERLRASAAAVLTREPRVRQVISVVLDYAREETARNDQSNDDKQRSRAGTAVITCIFDTVLGRRETIHVTGL